MENQSLLTMEQLKALSPRKARTHILQEILEFQHLLEDYDVTPGLRRQHFFAQLAHESDGFHTTEEYASGKAYEGREDLGNVSEGDGRRFKGRGLIQVTGRANYTSYNSYLHDNYYSGVDYVTFPERMAEFPGAIHGALWFWKSRKLNELADQDLLEKITKRVNGGYNGLEDRRKYLEKAKELEF